MEPDRISLVLFNFSKTNVRTANSPANKVETTNARERLISKQNHLVSTCFIVALASEGHHRGRDELSTQISSRMLSCQPT